jgi:hypothetical protein
MKMQSGTTYIDTHLRSIFKSEGTRRKKKEGRRDTIELVTSNFTPSNFWYGIAIPPVT